MSSPVTITMLKNLLREYRKRRWCCIYRDSTGVHMMNWPYGRTYVGELKWLRYKGER